MSKLKVYLKGLGEFCPTCQTVEYQLDFLKINYEKIKQGTSPEGVVPCMEYSGETTLDVNVMTFLRKIYQRGERNIFKNCTEETMRRIKGETRF